MCTAGVDCRWCSLIETCPKVRAAFPTRAEIEAEMPQRIRTRLRHNAQQGAKVTAPWYRKYPKKVKHASPPVVRPRPARLERDTVETTHMETVQMPPLLAAGLEAMMADKYGLTPKMQAALDYMMANGRVIVRHAGGYWAKADWRLHSGPHFGTSTIQALVNRGWIYYSKEKDGRNGPFPIEATLMSKEDAQP